MFYITDNSHLEDPVYCQTLISSAKNNVRIACAQLIKLNGTHREKLS